MRVTIIGTGYVGLTTGVTLAYLGHEVTCLDLDPHKIAKLRGGFCPFHEPGMDDLLGVVRSQIAFTASYHDSVPQADVIYIAVGTPARPDGSSDLTYLQQAAQMVGAHLNGKFAVVVNKSTVPIGSGNWVESIVRDSYEAQHGACPAGVFAVLSNPEFLREGSALHDSFYPDRIVVGSESERAIEVMRQIYKPILEQSFAAPAFLPRPAGLGAVPMVTADLASAELIKYAANAFLSLKISFINEIGTLAEKVGADVTQVARGMGLDARIGMRFLQAGLGWGGSCFGKDTSALIATGGEYGVAMPIIQAAREVNSRQRGRVVEKLLGELKVLKGRTVALLGLAFKPNTDDLRDAPALDIARRLVERGVKVKAHDPVALERARELYANEGIHFCDDPESMLAGADACVLVTEWPEYQELDWAKAARTMRNPLVLDGRNALPVELLQAAGMRVLALGRPETPGYQVRAAGNEQ